MRSEPYNIRAKLLRLSCSEGARRSWLIRKHRPNMSPPHPFGVRLWPSCASGLEPALVGLGNAESLPRSLFVISVDCRSFLTGITTSRRPVQVSLQCEPGTRSGSVREGVHEIRTGAAERRSAPGGDGPLGQGTLPIAGYVTCGARSTPPPRVCPNLRP